VRHAKGGNNVIKDRLIWEDALKEHFENFLQKVEIAKVPDVYTLTFLKAEVEKMEISAYPQYNSFIPQFSITLIDCHLFLVCPINLFLNISNT